MSQRSFDKLFKKKCFQYIKLQWTLILLWFKKVLPDIGTSLQDRRNKAREKVLLDWLVKTNTHNTPFGDAVSISEINECVINCQAVVNA